jgi:DGQHR domain-containing protein
MNKGEALNKRVWSLFEKAGFATEPSVGSQSEHHIDMGQGKKRKVDLFATEANLKVTIIGSNKSGGIEDSWTAHVNDWQDIGEKASASKVLFVLTGKELSPEDRNYAIAKGMCIWGEKELSYYEAIAETIKQYAKYEIIHALGISTKEQKDIHRVIALKVRQPDPESGDDLFLFSMSAERLLKTCAIYRRAQGSAVAYQRMLRRERLPKVLEYVTKTDAMLPTNIVVHLNEKVIVEDISFEELKDTKGRPLVFSAQHGFALVALNIPQEYSSLELIDGQHRLFGFAAAEPATRAAFDLLVTGLKGLPADKRQEIFVSINDNSRRMDPNLVAYLRYTKDNAKCQQDNALMAIRVVVDLNDHSPFKNSIRLLDVGDQFITLKNFAGYDLKGLLGPRGWLRKYYPNNDPDEFMRALRLYFSTVRELFPEEWRHPEKYIISTNRGIAAFLKLLRSVLRAEKQQIDHSTCKKYLTALKAGFKSWSFADLKKTYVGSQGWSEFHRDLVKAIRDKYPSFKK